MKELLKQYLDAGISRRKLMSGLTAAGVRWAFTSVHAAYWHPVTWLSHGGWLRQVNRAAWSASRRWPDVADVPTRLITRPAKPG